MKGRNKVLRSIIRIRQFGVPRKLCMLFDCSTDNIGLHLKNIFASGELEKESVTEKISATASDGKNYMTQFYNLDLAPLLPQNWKTLPDLDTNSH